MYYLAGKFVIWKGAVNAIEERVEPAETNGVHAFGFGRGVVFEEFGQEDLNESISTPRELSF